MAKRDMVDHSAKEEPLYLPSCAKPYPVVMERIDLQEFAQHGGSYLMSSRPSLDVIAQAALSKSGCGTTDAPRYRVETSFDVTGKMMGALCGYQVGGAYALVLGSYGGRCVNFKSAKIMFTVFDVKTRKELFTTTAETDASAEDEISGGRFLKGVRESGSEVGEFSKSPEGRVIAEVTRKGLEALVKDLSKAGASALEKTKSPDQYSSSPANSAKNKSR